MTADLTNKRVKHTQLPKKNPKHSFPYQNVNGEEPHGVADFMRQIDVQRDDTAVQELLNGQARSKVEVAALDPAKLHHRTPMRRVGEGGGGNTMGVQA